MKATNRRRQAAHVRAEAVCADHRGTFDATPGGKKMLAQLDTSVADVTPLFADQQRGLEEVRAGAAARRKACGTLRARLTVVVRMRRFVGLDAGTAEPFQMPRSRARSCSSPTRG